jgi:hypothetical protein
MARNYLTREWFHMPRIVFQNLDKNIELFKTQQLITKARPLFQAGLVLRRLLPNSI